MGAPAGQGNGSSRPGPAHGMPDSGELGRAEAVRSDRANGVWGLGGATTASVCGRHFRAFGGVRSVTFMALAAAASYLLAMTFLGAGGFGVLGGLAAGLVAFSAAIVKAGLRWPGRGNPDGVWPRVTVYAVGIIVGAIVSACSHAEMSGEWPAFLMGVAAPSVIQNAIGLVEVAETPAVVAVDVEVQDASAV
jgi:hypothetical protein